MRKFVLYLDKHTKLITRTGLLLFTMVFIVFLFPREGKFPYEYQRGKPWMHGDLSASFDFPVRKSDRELNREKDSILKEFKPYYNFKEQVADEQLKKMRKSFSSVWQKFAEKRINHSITEAQAQFFQKADSTVKFSYRQYIAELLTTVYQNGILEVNEQIEKAPSKDFSLVILRNNIGEDADFSDVFTPKAAYEYIIKHVNSLKPSNERDETIVDAGFFKELNINEFIFPNLFYNDEASKNVKDDLIRKISFTKGMYASERKIISKGEIVNDEKLNLLQSYRYEYENRIGHSDKRLLVILGQALIVSGLLTLLMVYMIYFRREVYHNNVNLGFMFLLIVLMTGTAALALRKDLFSLYIIPFSLIPLILRTFYDARLALFVHMVTVLLVSFMAPNSFEFIVLNFTAGTIAVISLTNLYRRSRLFVTALYVFVTYSVIFFALNLLQGISIGRFPYQTLEYFAANGFLLLLAYPMIYIFEKTFGFLSDIKLMELADTNQPLLRRLNEKAPGTFQHSMQVANLAEEAAFLIGANPLLVRVGAMYHDIGKILHPMYFIENVTLDKSPHVELSSEESARIIIEHVYKGIDIARKAKLPEQIIDFIRTHHGNSTVQYFYRTFLKSNPESDVDKSKFTYPGPIPFSKEMALVMMADSVEAASRSLKEVTHTSINDLVDNIIYYQMINEQFNDSAITYKDLSIVKGVFKRKLLNMYHIRVEYPAQV
jgi:cyclic-di-AMP phosphodiesterase PgpH